MFCRTSTNTTRDALITLIHALAISKVNYCKSIPGWVTGILISRLQLVFNAAADLIFAAQKSYHITPLLENLHWLKARERIRFHWCVMVHLLSCPLTLASSIEGRCRLRSTDGMDSLVPVTSCRTLDDRSFPAATAQVGNTLPSSVRLYSSIYVFVAVSRQSCFLSHTLLKLHFYNCFVKCLSKHCYNA